MSDTSIVEYDDYTYETHDDSYRRRGDCWTNIGANICVGILAVTTIVLAAALAYVHYQQNRKGNAVRRANENGDDSDYLVSAAGGVVNALFGGSSDSSE